MISAVELPVTTTNDIDNCFERKREGGIEFGTGTSLVTHNTILKFFEKEKEKGREEYDNIMFWEMKPKTISEWGKNQTNKNHVHFY